VAQARFPGIWREGFQHPLLLGLADVISAMGTANQPYNADEICLGEASFERQICYDLEADSERIRIYVNDIARRKRAENWVRPSP
jgi:hypothetical protein